MPKRHTKKYTIGSVLLLLIVGAVFFVRGPGRKYFRDLDVSPKPTYVAGSAYTGDSVRFVFAGIPKGGEKLRMLENEAYLVAYDEQRDNPAWVGYRLQGKGKFTDYKRHGRFSVDDRTDAKVSHGDYTRRACRFPMPSSR